MEWEWGREKREERAQIRILRFEKLRGVSKGELSMTIQVRFKYVVFALNLPAD